MSFFRNAISAIYNAVSAPVASTTNALTARLQNVRDIISDYYKKIKDEIKKQLNLHDEIEFEAQEDHIEDVPDNLYEEPADLTPREHKHALHKTFRSFRIPGVKKTDVDSYLALVRPHVEQLIIEQVEDMGSAKVQLSMWIVWKKNHACIST